MLDDISETKATMQADEVDGVICKETDLIPTEMTFKVDEEVKHSKFKVEPHIDEIGTEAETTRYKGINLEDDIEKVEVSSPESSEDEDFDSTPSIKDGDLNLFNKIPTQNPNDSIKTWLQKITEVQNEMQKKYLSGLGGNVQIPLNSLMNNPPLINAPASSSTPNPSRVVKYQDLPYMGEMTLDNSKPRRGRKPKKADICHLIYKNYGTIFPGTPNPGSYLEKENNIFKKSDLPEIKDGEFNRSDVQHRIISSLLEKRLTQEYNRSKDAKNTHNDKRKDKTNQEEPLNLCIRDLNHLKIRLLKKHDNTYTSEIKSEPQSDDDIEMIQDSSPNNQKGEPKFPLFPPEGMDPLKTADGTAGPGGYVYWSNAGVFIHPVALQQQLMMYQRMAAGNSYILPTNHSPKPPPETSTGASKENGSNELRKLVPKSIKPKPNSPKVDSREESTPSPQAQDIKKRNAPNSENSKTPTKRKRSAIFIPPIPTENNANPATEVSICKFKFTGGAKPSLQEKKMLSVDSGGNFRYYSGTGDKSMRGYEFFPRETLQQQINNTHGSSTGAFLQATGEKIFPSPPPDFAGVKASPEFLLGPEIPTTPFPSAQTSSHDLQRMKKRKSRKSIQREKLEQTFKEKGFLIQTQQTENAEGATYCKFRQLRKFTRYLFRSWKDYLPGNIAEDQQGKPILPESSELSRDNTDEASVHSSEVSVSNA
ncbi:unnamed protein product [Phyllotreta striolata]|uniref:Uncharacterized protein n=1 Tax=Phyllotreta striolata TaxID=444603 RepID=A0A9N9TK93_PHYSR|nr:unnamed protein product [Phyllotreta striolata]